MAPAVIKAARNPAARARSRCCAGSREQDGSGSGSESGTDYPFASKDSPVPEVPRPSRGASLCNSSGPSCSSRVPLQSWKSASGSSKESCHNQSNPLSKAITMSNPMAESGRMAPARAIHTLGSFLRITLPRRFGGALCLCGMGKCEMWRGALACPAMLCRCSLAMSAGNGSPR
jgi:hypothetical protein